MLCGAQPSIQLDDWPSILQSSRMDGAMKERVVQLKARLESQHAETNAKLVENLGG